MFYYLNYISEKKSIINIALLYLKVSHTNSSSVLREGASVFDHQTLGLAPNPATYDTQCTTV